MIATTAGSLWLLEGCVLNSQRWDQLGARWEQPPPDLAPLVCNQWSRSDRPPTPQSATPYLAHLVTLGAVLQVERVHQAGLAVTSRNG